MKLLKLLLFFLVLIGLASFVSATDFNVGLSNILKMNTSTAKLVDYVGILNSTSVTGVTREINTPFGLGFECKEADSVIINMGTEGVPRFGESRTLNIIINFTVTDGSSHMIWEQGVDGSCTAFNLARGGTTFTIQGGAGGCDFADGTVGKDAWYMLTYTYDNSTGNGSFYINGTLSASQIKTWGTDITRLNVCSNLIGNQRTDAVIAEYQIWNKTLPPVEIVELYNNGDILTHPFEVIVPDAEAPLVTDCICTTCDAGTNNTNTTTPNINCTITDATGVKSARIANFTASYVTMNSSRNGTPGSGTDWILPLTKQDFEPPFQTPPECPIPLSSPIPTISNCSGLYLSIKLIGTPITPL